MEASRRGFGAGTARRRAPRVSGGREAATCDNCGEKVDLPDAMTNRCDKCGTFYNGSGQRLNPPSMWGEETGESFDSFGNQTGFVDFDDEW